MATTLINQLVENIVESLVEEVTKRVLIHFDTLSLRLQVLEKTTPADEVELAALYGRLSTLEKAFSIAQNNFNYEVTSLITDRLYDKDIPNEDRVKDLIGMYAPEEGVSIEDVIELINDRVRIVVE